MQISPLPRSFRLGLFAAAALLLVFFNLRSGKVTSVEQREFEAWLSAQDDPMKPVEDAPLPSSVTVSLNGYRRLGDPPIAWQLRSADGPEARDRALRILQMAREANLFSVTDRPGPEVPLVLEIQEGDKIFRAGISDAIVERNMRVATMLRLFQEYATIPPATVVATLPLAEATSSDQGQ